MVTEKEYQKIKNRPSDIPIVNRIIEKNKIEVEQIRRKSEEELKEILGV